MTGPTDFCRNLAWALSQRGWTTCDLADRLCPIWHTKHNSACRRIRRYVSGAQVPKLDTVELFAQLLHIAPEELAFGGCRSDQTYPHPYGWKCPQCIGREE